jgi:hypothetical protein
MDEERRFKALFVPNHEIFNLVQGVAYLKSRIPPRSKVVHFCIDEMAYGLKIILKNENFPHVPPEQIIPYIRPLEFEYRNQVKCPNCGSVDIYNYTKNNRDNCTTCGIKLIFQSDPTTGEYMAAKTVEDHLLEMHLAGLQCELGNEIVPEDSELTAKLRKAHEKLFAEFQTQLRDKVREIKDRKDETAPMGLDNFIVYNDKMNKEK